MTPRSLSTIIGCAAILALAAAPARAQSGAAAALTTEQIAVLAKTQVLIGAIHDSVDAQLAHPRNKKDENQTQLRDMLRTEIAAILKANDLTDEEYQRRTFIISSNGGARERFDSVVVVLTGAPLPGAVQGRPAAAPVVAVPAGAVGVHIGHVVNAFGDTPDRAGLLATALAEARVALQHARLATAQPTNLAYMQTHAGHVIHAVDPTVVTAGPGAGYGVKKAALGVATHIELAAAGSGATAPQVLHAGHVAVSARNTVTRADQILEMAQQVRSATSAADAAALIGQIVSLAQQLTEGADSNGDGRITWQLTEGGLQHCDEHVKLMLGGGR
ncbi:MAG: hypothetical protein O2973_12095 [Gemmatimonadetes bacterium]|nr:hypothetical protein [Gemmatimonadota bacterium]